MIRTQTTDTAMPSSDVLRHRPARSARTFLAGFVTITGMLIMTACADKTRTDASAPSSRPGNFPVVEPFALDQAGSKLTIAFDLPDAPGDDGLEPVFIGFRAVNAASDGTDGMLESSKEVTAYLLESPLPIRARLWRIDGPMEQSVDLYDRHRDIESQKTWYEKNPGDIFTHQSAGSTDNGPLIAAGLYDNTKVYYVHEIARISPPTPGRYRLEVESLESHPTLIELKRVLPELRYELLVSHYYPR
ncbi:hypothetical protein LDO32_06915 [Luteimonas sp. Y-2-2-4F]|nr:hypothetical protein [Luteimonas sp. Y-2-2-4F]MCD9031457.1 hypothetical protein [Luteimonas sp. Y-2-2-4F]